ncbi:jg25798 [Pararge aegeria aegeria]|uniref:Jg25798 protein n=2 Tax=Pararge aegeria TaxID=116150 RepID=A0A8S4QVI8_9NEOP|nr:jg25798 [Pararge aegeria aegeria]
MRPAAGPLVASGALRAPRTEMSRLHECTAHATSETSSRASGYCRTSQRIVDTTRLAQRRASLPTGGCRDVRRELFSVRSVFTLRRRGGAARRAVVS